MDPSRFKKWLLFPLLAGCIVSALAAVTGCGDIEPGRFEAPAVDAFTPAHTATAAVEEITDWYEAVGTVRPRTETRIESQITAQVLAVAINPGDRVTQGQLLVSLDSRQLKSRLNQARQALKQAVAGKEQARQAAMAADAAFKEARSQFERVKKYFKGQAATASDLEKAESAFLQAEAGVKQTAEGLAAAQARIRQAQEVVKESDIAMGYTRITATETGVVLKRFVEPGDLALPGKPLISLRTAGALRFEAFVREGLISRTAPGRTLKVDLQTLNRTADARVEEVVPYADPRSRTFLVKVSLPPMDGLFPGMFGKLRIPAGTHPAVLIPKDAVRRVGQLELVYVQEEGKWRSRYITTGNPRGDRVEVLSGLRGEEAVGWRELNNG